MKGDLNLNFENKIPKIIHYCWFGKGEKPKIVEECIKSWNKYLSDYEIIEWNESNFDINSNLYIKQAYESRKYAFVSDYVRVFALYKYGGIYLDTDVEVFKDFNDLLDNESFWGFEQENYIATSTIGARKGNKIIGDFLNSYKDKKFYKEDGSFDELTNVAIITSILKKYGLIQDGKYQEIYGLATFYPQTYFSPYDYINCRKIITNNTYCMHHFYKSWLPIGVRIKGKIKLVIANIIGGDNILRLRKLISK
ncbi:glycosyl transferase [Clostridium perfringens]|uniref:Glycosyl transferase n=1 Tax=Clostridium perfringens TaxID=1502 RepID=A0AAE8FRQ0_CLOPF|nr:glycosyl transferase [Clostridium perfringens]RQN22469.1 glycosyl transferase [Clostridium perfringens]HAT4138294.1 glycosyl transferase [Clostridium perfringens]